MSRVVCVWCVYAYVHVGVCVCVISGWVCMCKGCTCTLIIKKINTNSAHTHTEAINHYKQCQEIIRTPGSANWYFYGNLTII